jgi:hypothetical protein
MEVRSFAEIEEGFIRRVHTMVWCNMATVDGKQRPRSRIVHPIWEGQTGWIGTHRTSHKQNTCWLTPMCRWLISPTL